MNIGARVTKLEAQRPQPMRWHSIIRYEHESLEMAMQRYGRDRILPGDNLIFRQVVEVLS